MDIFIYVVKHKEAKEHSVDFDTRLNAFLDVYSLYLKTGISSVREEAIMKAYELHLSRPEFSFVL